ncbi:helix-turn-helix transcriptional regulator [Cohnella sp. JJ-181]|uniref:helix-turn-helix transcriptional regulator n=1 Tax=Cohnella rhizoplanae TaxID=2974897 RepID=UPI00232B9B7F|nr:helix-turn-helix transcriptional regulator [Cohnella sp. JJ-181]
MKLVNLEKERVKRDWTQEHLADLVGVARSTYANWESGKREPDLTTIEKLADIFEVSVDYLLGRDLYATPKNHDSSVNEPAVQFILRAKKELSSKDFERMMELTRKAREMFDDTDK